MSEDIDEIPKVNIYIYNPINLLLNNFLIQEAYQLKSFLITTANINNYDFNTMIKDLEASTRHENHLKVIKKQFQDESKKYKETVEHMKEFQEETYQKKNKELVKKLNKKDKILLSALKNNQKNKMKERQKIIDLMMKKEKAARENVEKFLIKQEKERQALEVNTNGKSNYTFYLN